MIVPGASAAPGSVVAVGPAMRGGPLGPSSSNGLDRAWASKSCSTRPRSAAGRRIRGPIARPVRLVGDGQGGGEQVEFAHVAISGRVVPPNTSGFCPESRRSVGEISSRIFVRSTRSQARA